MQKILCQQCNNYLGDLVCQAFPKGIPDVILIGDNNHETPLEGQGNTIVYEPLESKPAFVVPMPQKSNEDILNFADALRKAIRIEVD